MEYKEISTEEYNNLTKTVIIKFLIMEKMCAGIKMERCTEMMVQPL